MTKETFVVKQDPDTGLKYVSLGDQMNCVMKKNMCWSNPANFTVKSY